MDNAPRSTSLLKAHDSKEKRNIRRTRRSKKIGVDTFTEFCFHLFFFVQYYYYSNAQNV